MAVDLETSFYKSRAQGAYRFDPWTAEIEAMNQSAENMARLVGGIGSLIKAAFRALGRAVQALRQTAPVEVEPVEIARPADLSGVSSANDRAAA
jgi:hypothetical protein